MTQTIQYLDPLKVITVWKCPDCDDKCEVDVTFFQDNGTPMCAECPDQDMEFDYVYRII